MAPALVLLLQDVLLLLQDSQDENNFECELCDDEMDSYVDELSESFALLSAEEEANSTSTWTTRLSRSSSSPPRSWRQT